jgi:hypothetical protein
MKTITFALALLVASVAATEHQVSSINNAEADEAQDLDEYDSADTEKSNLRRLQNGPNAAKRMAAWKKAHNDMRKKYHEEFGGEFVPINWNMELKQEAEAWAKQLVTNCVNRAPGSTMNPNNYGVNSAMRSGQTAFQNPVNVMEVWEKKLPLGYPANSVMTQVLWAKTGLVGCADASSSSTAEKKCAASVCFYSKAGNCAFGRFGGNGNWTQAVMNGPACSTICPSNVEEC